MRSGGWRPSAIASTIRGDRNPSRQQPMHGAAIEFFPPRYLGDRLHAARDQVLRPPAGAGDRFEQGQIDPAAAVASPSSTMRISTPRRFICIGTNLVRTMWSGGAPFCSSAGGIGSLSVTRMPSRLRSVRSIRSASAAAASRLAAQPLTPRLSGLEDRRQPMRVDAGLLDRLRDGIAVGEDLSGGG